MSRLGARAKELLLAVGSHLEGLPEPALELVVGMLEKLDRQLLVARTTQSVIESGKIEIRLQPLLERVMRVRIGGSRRGR